MTEIQEKRKLVEDKNFILTGREIRNLTEFHVSHFLSNHKKVLDKMTKVSFLDGKPFLCAYNRITIGAHGAYVEFQDEHLLTELEIPESEQWRLDQKYNVKYKHFTPVGRCDKVYRQMRTVDYADYVVGRYYIDFYLTNLEEIFG
jgi:hypothetical protein